MIQKTCVGGLLCTVILSVGLIACGEPPQETPATYSEVYGQMKTLCGSCHNTGGTAIKVLVIDSASSANTYTNITSKNLINKSSPSLSPLVVVGKGGANTDGSTHSKQLNDTTAARWVSWITNGAAQ